MFATTVYVDLSRLHKLISSVQSFITQFEYHFLFGRVSLF